MYQAIAIVIGSVVITGGIIAATKRYEISAFTGGVYRLNTWTGTVSLCSPSEVTNDADILIKCVEKGK
jgi:hypothetical protein